MHCRIIGIGDEMILFVSGRCDIPAFYSTWFFNRMKAGFVDVRNPFNTHQISRILLDKEHIDCILFCTKNPIPMLPRLHEMGDIPFLFHITMTPYKEDLEQISNKKEIIMAIHKLSQQLGKERVIIRYDPILLTPRYTVAYHRRAFEKLCQELHEDVDKIIISFVDMYKNTRANTDQMGLQEMTVEAMQAVGKELGAIGERYAMKIQTCAEDIDLSQYHIKTGLCVDQGELEHIIGHSIERPRGKGVRKVCNCLPTVDIGDYNCCAHHCLYCYANYDAKQIQSRMRSHDPNSSVLLGHISEEDHVTIREDKKVKQMKLL